MSNPASETGLFASLRRLLVTTLEIAQVRLDILGTEFELEKRRLVDGVLYASIAILAFGIGLVLMCGFLILLFWDGYRLAAVGTLSALFMAIGVLLLHRAHRNFRMKKNIFSVSLAELESDRIALSTLRPHE
jgi:uncharacterized membrane protein YqjE